MNGQTGQEDVNALDKQIEVNDEQAKLDKENTCLEKWTRKKSQPKKRLELAQRVNAL